jgi:hypothetical protein
MSMTRKIKQKDLIDLGFVNQLYTHCYSNKWLGIEVYRMGGYYFDYCQSESDTVFVFLRIQKAWELYWFCALRYYEKTYLVQLDYIELFEHLRKLFLDNENLAYFLGIYFLCHLICKTTPIKTSL